MKVTFVMDGGDNRSGGHRAIAFFAHGLRMRGHEVVLVARPIRPLTARQRLRSLLRGGIAMRASAAAPSHFRDLDVPLCILPEWRPVIAADVPDADVVVATWWETVEWVWSMPARKGVKVQLMQDYEEWGGPRDAVDRSCELPLAKIVTSPWLPEFLETRFQQKALAAIDYGVSRAAFDAPPRGKRPVPTIGLIYSDLHRKGTDISFEAFRMALREVPELRLLVAGNSAPTSHLPLPAGTHFTLGASDSKLRELYSQCDAWLFGTRKEGFGLPVLEAMACRTPVIATPAGAAPQLLRDGGGILVSPEDPERMANAIVAICRMDNAEWQSLSSAAHAAADTYSWEAAVLKFERALLQAVDQKALA